MPKKQSKPERVATNAFKHLSNLSVNDNDPKYIPPDMIPYINDSIRRGKKQFDKIEMRLNTLDRTSDKYSKALKEREVIAKKFVNIRTQVDKYNQNQRNFQSRMSDISPGTKDESYYNNIAFYGNQWDSMAIDDDGFFHFGISIEDGAKPQFYKLDDFDSNNEIILENYKGKTDVFKLAEITKRNSDMGKQFDEKWINEKILNTFSNTGPSGVISLAFADLAGDGRTKSFAQMYEEGLADPLLYVHPETGEKLPKDSGWMKEPEKADLLSQLMSRYLTNVMKDISGANKQNNLPTREDSIRKLIEQYKNK
jgi:hypothetical protein